MFVHKFRGKNILLKVFAKSGSQAEEKLTSFRLILPTNY